jgi:outer membrane protein W
MRRLVLATAAVALLLLPATTRAQSFEASGFVGFTPAAAIDRQAEELDSVDWEGGVTWGGQAAFFFTPRLGAEVMLTRQSSGLSLGTDAGTVTLFEATTRQLHFNAVYRFGAPDARLRPFVFGGAGSTYFSADDLASESKFSWNLGGGATYMGWGSLGIRGHFRYKPTALADEDAGDFCDPFGFCQSTLQQIEIAAGAVFRF